MWILETLGNLKKINKKTEPNIFEKSVKHIKKGMQIAMLTILPSLTGCSTEEAKNYQQIEPVAQLLENQELYQEKVQKVVEEEPKIYKNLDNIDVEVDLQAYEKSLKFAEKEKLEMMMGAFDISDDPQLFWLQVAQIQKKLGTKEDQVIKI